MNNITYAVSVDVNNPIIPYNVYVASVLDSNVRYLEITLYQNGNVIALSNEATATASLVTDDVLVDDSVECTISNNIITVPLEDLQRHGNLDVQVTVTEGTKVLAIPFPIQVRVTPNIAEEAQIDENSLGSYAEIVQEIAEARNGHNSLDERLNSDASGKEAVMHKVQSIGSMPQTFDNVHYPSVTAVRDYVNIKTDDLQDHIEGELDELDEAKAGKTDTNAQFERLIAVLQRKADSAETLAGYGINDAYTKAETDSLVSTDPTLSVQGKAAEAKTVGEQLARLNGRAAMLTEVTGTTIKSQFLKQDTFITGEGWTVSNNSITTTSYSSYKRHPAVTNLKAGTYSFYNALRPNSIIEYISDSSIHKLSDYVASGTDGTITVAEDFNLYFTSNTSWTNPSMFVNGSSVPSGYVEGDYEASSQLAENVTALNEKTEVLTAETALIPLAVSPAKKQVLKIEDAIAGGYYGSPGNITANSGYVYYAPVSFLRKGEYCFRNLTRGYTHFVFPDGTSKKLSDYTSANEGRITVEKDFTLYASSSAAAISDDSTKPMFVNAPLLPDSYTEGDYKPARSIAMAGAAACFDNIDEQRGSVTGSRVRYISSEDIFYPLNLKQGDAVVLRAKDGTAFADYVYLEFYDANYTYINRVSVMKNKAVTMPYGAVYGKVSNLHGKVLKIVVGGNGLEEYLYPPDYYFTDNYLQGKATFINNLLAESAGNGDTFFFVTDQHWGINAKKSPALVRWLRNHTGINRLFDGGDRAEGYNVTEEDENAPDVARQFRLAMGDGEYFPVVGNHEFIHSATVSQAFHSAYMGLPRNIVWGAPQKFYYYADNPVQKMRYIFLQAYDEHAEGSSSASAGYDNAQLAWLQNTALNVDAGWTIVIVTHHLTSSNTETAGEYYAIPPLSGSRLEAYNIINNYSGSGTIACVLEGHKHWDTSLVMPCGVPIITTTCDKWYMQNEAGLSNREFGTIEEQAFDVGIIDKTQRKITMVRIGGKALDNHFEECEYREFNY